MKHYMYVKEITNNKKSYFFSEYKIVRIVSIEKCTRCFNHKYKIAYTCKKKRIIIEKLNSTNKHIICSLRNRLKKVTKLDIFQQLLEDK